MAGVVIALARTTARRPAALVGAARVRAARMATARMARGIVAAARWQPGVIARSGGVAPSCGRGSCPGGVVRPGLAARAGCHVILRGPTKLGPGGLGLPG